MEPSRNYYIDVGIRRPTTGLIQQARLTANLVSHEPPAFAETLPDPAYVGTMMTLTDQVEKAAGDRAVAEADSVGATVAQNDSMSAAKVWGRKVRARVGRARAMGISVPDGLMHARSARTVPTMIAALSDSVALLEHSMEDLKPAGGDIEGLIAEGKKIHGELSTYDAIQESALRNSVPEAVRDFWEAKGRLYIALKVVNNAAREFYADDLERAARYNMKLVYGK